MASLLFTIGGQCISLVFSRFTDHGKEERRLHDLALEKLHRVRNKWNEDRMKWLDFMNKNLREKK